MSTKFTNYPGENNFLVDFELTYTKLDSLSIIDVISALDTAIGNGVLIGNEISFNEVQVGK